VYPVLLLLLQAQPAAPPPEPSLPVSLERIRRGLESPPGTVTVTSSAPGLPPVFRMEVQEQSLEYEHLWQDGSLTPAYVRPTRNLYQHEFLGAVTPDLFRATAVHPCCDVLPAIEYVGRTLRQGLRKSSESRARREVRKAIEEHARAHRPAEKQ
jgi:hypothetical protein